MSRTRVHCCACLKNGIRTPNYTCRHCGSQDVFTAGDLLLGELEQAKSAGSIAMWGFIVDEWERMQ